MNYLQSFAISAAGMGVERMRVETAAMNLAHANIVQEPGTAGYRPMHVVARIGHAFAAHVEAGAGPMPRPRATLTAAAAALRLVHEPAHPLANAQGFIAYPGVDPAREMMTLMGALRAYEANVAAMNTARTLVLKTLEIGRAG